jgi:hypothetical protein
LSAGPAGGYRQRVLSRLKVGEVGKDEARQARRLLADAELHGHEYAINAVLAVIARRQRGQATVFTSDVDSLQKLVPDTIVVKQVCPPAPASILVSFASRRTLVCCGQQSGFQPQNQSPLARGTDAGRRRRGPDAGSIPASAGSRVVGLRVLRWPKPYRTNFRETGE